MCEKIKLRSLIRLTVIMLSSIFMSGCGDEVKETSVSGNSIMELVKKLPNMEGLGIESCKYTISTSIIGGRLEVPGPSDTQLMLRGTAILSENGFKELTSRFKWESAERKDIPNILLEVLPAGEIVVSRELNKCFEQNPTYCHGFVARLTSDNSKRIYFVVSDLDHPIK